MKGYHVLLAFMFSIVSFGQSTYSKLINQADDLLEEHEDEQSKRQAFSLYEKAFKSFPDSITAADLSEISIIASELKEADKAFAYLDRLIKIERAQYGFPGWQNVTNKSALEEYKNLLDDPRWASMMSEAHALKAKFDVNLKEAEEEFYKVKSTKELTSTNGKKLYEEIKAYNPYLPKAKQDYSISFAINDTVKTSFFIHLPKNYSPEKEYPVLFFLHGAVRYNNLQEFQTKELSLGGWNRYYTKYGDLDEVILIFPSGGKKYNWMTSNDGFFMIPAMLREVKKAINVDDNKVFIAGHSNGATGSFSYLMKDSSPFAGFYGFNTQPKVFTGGTFIENIMNRSFINFSTDEDYYYPSNANDSFTAMMNELKADYKEYRYNGFPHWFPEFDESEPAYEILFKDLKERQRKSFNKELTWEFDDNAYGGVDWLTNIKLDTLGQKADWHKERNFKITKWLEYDKAENLQTIDVDKNAFDMPRLSGKAVARYKDNEFRIETSRVKSLSIAISPEMVNLKNKVKVYVNGKLYYDEKVDYDTAFMLDNFDKTRDRKTIWINKIDITVK
ncbi:alpha/beta hydrolase-fold protein [Myroides odoratimimus]|uniref:alpha/beta hydrolase-fold protein n=1 Tax=Myroides odoratimimus TaxID=76832 RepID=UPI003F42F157